MPTNRKEHLRYRYGICLNDACSKCKSKEIQQIAARKDFVCAECGKPLRECPPPKTFWDKNGKWIILGAVTVVVAVVVIWLVGKPSEKVDDAVKTVAVQTKTVVKEKANTTKSVTTPAVIAEPEKDTKAKESKAKEAAPEKDKTSSKPAPSKSNVKVPFGTYSGPADGLGGTIKVTSYYSLDLRNAAHESLELHPGDVITRTQFRNGELVGGYLQSASGNRSFHR